MNGVRRAVSSPRRLIGLIVVIGYYFQFFLRPFSGRDPSTMPMTMPSGGIVQFNPEVLQAGAFTLFAALSLLLMLTSFNPRGGFRPADVDVLFATPISPKVVLVFRIVRDYLITLLFPLFVALLTGRTAGPAVFALMRDFPEQGRIVTRLFTWTYLLMTLCWVCIGYALSLFINRSDIASDRNKKIIDRTLMAVFMLTFLYVGYRFRVDPGWDTALDVTRSPLLRIVFFTSTAATAVIMAPFHGSWVEGIAGVAFMLAIIGISLRIAMTQVDFLYDQAAAKGFQVQDMRNLQRSGDTYGMFAAQAQKGKVRGGWFTRIVGRWQFRGAGALLWKELLLHGRTGLWQYGILGPVVLFMVLLPLWSSSQSSRQASSPGLFLGMLGFGAFILSMNNAQSGFIELLRRVDFQKPLPFSPTVTVFWEVAAKAVPTVVIAALACIGGIIVRPDIWGTALSGIVMAPTLSLVLAAVALLVMVLFPDVDDAAQRGFRGLMMLLGIAIAVLPSLAVAVGMMIFHVPTLIVAIPFVLINLAVAAGVSAIAGGLYSSYNPSE